MAAATAPGLLLLVVAVLLIPGTFQVAGSVLSPYRVLLLAMFPFLVRRWVTDTGGRPATTDILMLASCLWLGLSLVANHGLGTIPRATIVFVEMFGGYLVGRTLIRNRIDHKNYFRFLTLAFLVLLPFVVLEALTLVNIPRKIAELVLTLPPRTTWLGYRLGIHRAQGTLEHPILFGLVASMGVANVAYIWRDSLREAVPRTLLFVGMVFMTVSTGPLLSVFIQLSLMAWDRALAFLRFRWLLLAYLVLLGSPGDPDRGGIPDPPVHRRSSLPQPGLRRGPLRRLRLRHEGGAAASGLRHRPERLDAALVARQRAHLRQFLARAMPCATGCRPSASWRWPGGSTSRGSRCRGRCRRRRWTTDGAT